MTESRRPKDEETHIGNHKLDPSTLMMGYGFDPALQRRLAETADLPDFDLRVRDAPLRGSASSKASPTSMARAARPRAWSIRASTAPTRKSSRTGSRSGRTPRPR